jgi:hypothetical protein
MSYKALMLLRSRCLCMGGRAIEDVVTIELENTALLEEMCWR